MLKEDLIMQQKAALTLARLGPAAREFEAELLARLRRADAADRPFFRVSLLMMGDDGFPNIRDHRRRQVLQALLDLIRAAEAREEDDAQYPAEDRLKLRSDFARVADEAGELLLLVADTDEEVVSRLKREMQAPKVVTRHAAAIALCRLPTARTEALPVVLETISQAPHLFLSAADTLAALGPEAREAVPMLMRMLRHEHFTIYREAVRVLERVSPQSISRVWGPAALTRSSHPQQLNLSRQELAQAWEQLAGSNPADVYQTSWRLALAGDAAVTLFHEKLKATATPDAAVVERLVADLGSVRFRTRQKAENELAILERLAGPALRKALLESPVLEKRRRIDALIEKFDPIRSPERMRVLRAVAVLEALATPAARDLLQTLAAGAPAARLTIEAQRALREVSR